MGRKISEEHKRNLSLAWDYNKHFTPECRKKLSESGKGRHHSEESKLKMRKPKLITHPAWNKGLNKTDQRVKKYIRKRLEKGYKHSEETKIKLSESHKGKTTWNKGKILPQFSRENHPNWLGGKSFEPYTTDWTKTLKRSIRERDKYTCQNCGKPQEEETFHIHHIDYNKENCNPINLITLCHSCHTKTNHHRDKWMKYFIEQNVKK